MSMSMTRSDIRKRLGLRPVINVSGTMTSLGASIAPPSVVEAVSAILPEFVEIDDLQAKASAVIARLTGAEAGCVTASASAGITLAVAGAMTGCDLRKVRRLPETDGLKNQVVVQSGHLVTYGAPIEQGIRLAGAEVVSVGSTNLVETAELEGAITEQTAAALFVVSHHTVQFGMLPLEELARVCHARGVPVIADVASEYDLRGFLAAGADLAIYSAHKFLGGPTAGIVAGNKALVQATYFQNLGIGRGMKVGKEGVVGTIAALEAWQTRDHDAVRAVETGYLDIWLERLEDRRGLTVVVEPDPTNNPLDRLKVSVDAEQAGVSAWDLAHRLGAHDPPIIVRDHEIELGFFYLDPCNLHEGKQRSSPTPSSKSSIARDRKTRAAPRSPSCAVAASKTASRGPTDGARQPFPAEISTQNLNCSSTSPSPDSSFTMSTRHSGSPFATRGPRGRAGYPKS